MSSKLVCSCIICRKVITTNNIKRHTNSASCNPYSGKEYKEHCCKYCGLDLTQLPASKRPSHVKWCTENPKLQSNIDNLSKARESARESARSVESNAKRSTTIQQLHDNGHYVKTYDKLSTINKSRDYRHTEQTRILISESARKSTHQRVCKSTHVFIDKRGREFKFDSSWEDALAIRLDELNVLWERPNPIEYFVPEENKTRKYFPDFYLPETDVYLDPKNPYCCIMQHRKIEIVSNMINLKILHSLEECKNFTI